MPHLIVIDAHEGQRRHLEEQIAALEKDGRTLIGKFEAVDSFEDWRALFESAGSRGLFAEREITVAEGCDALGPFPDGMIGALEPPEADSVIIATLGSAAKVFSKDAAKRITIIKKDPDVPPWRRREWLMNLAKEKGCRLASDAAELLGESIDSLEELRSELAKLSEYAGERPITVEDVRLLSFDEGAKALLMFLDGICTNSAADVARSMRYLRGESILPSLTALCNRLRPAMWMTAFPKSQAAALKTIGAEKQYAVRMAESALKSFGPDAVRRFMLGAVRLCYAEKTSFAEGWQGFEMLVWELMSAARSAPR